ncbi:transmembrane protein 220-like [Asterias amurensis]|uniref:transmembrane protein 220-like n=1 Tax=Asterias amurensis TaxID=7602 RepID=UPI003AB225CA
MDSLTGPGLVKPNLSLGSDNESKVMTKDGKVTTPHRWLWSGINAVMAVFFALAAFVQLNDPDPYLWIPVYMIPSFLCSSIVWSSDAVDSMCWHVTATVHMCLCAVGIAVLTFQTRQQMKNEMINPLALEEGRELFGLLIALMWILICKFSSRVKLVTSTKQQSALIWSFVLLGCAPLILWGTCYQSHFSHCGDVL